MVAEGGASLVERAAVFSPDGTTLLVPTGCSVSIYSVSTALLVNRLQGHTLPVTSVIVVPYTRAAKMVMKHAWTSSLDGSVKLWDVSSGKVIKSVNIGVPIYSMVIPSLHNPVSESSSKDGQLVAFMVIDRVHHTNVNGNSSNNQNGDRTTVVQNKKNKNDRVDIPQICRVVLYNLSNGEPARGNLAKISAPQTLATSQLGGMVGIVDTRKIWIWKVTDNILDDAIPIESIVLHHTKTLRALAIDPSETVVAGADENGRLLIWRNVGEKKFVLKKKGVADEKSTDMNETEYKLSVGSRGADDAAALTTYIWHSEAINFLMFSADGSYLFSGGKEAVLVIWQMETGKQQFLPRLGSPLLHIACSMDPSLLSVSCMNNGIKFINIGKMDVEKVIQGIKPAIAFPKRSLQMNIARASVQPQSWSVVLPSANLSLQFYDVFYDRHITEVQISPRNFVTSNKNSMGEAYVTHVIFSRDGSVMATAEVRIPEDGIGGVSCLKFWKQKSEKYKFSLNTQVDEPHSAEVSGFAYHPSIDMAVSSSESGDFKVWKNKSLQPSSSSPCWRCQSVGSYQQKRMSLVSFSPDGTLLAVVAEELITLWNPHSNSLICVIANTPTLQPIQMLSFIHQTNRLVTASWGDKPTLTVWDLQTLSSCWSYNMKVEAIASDPRSPHFVIMASTTEVPQDKEGHNSCDVPGLICAFNAVDPFPVAIWNIKSVLGADMVFLPPHLQSTDLGESCDDTGKLFVLNGSREYAIVNPYKNENVVVSIPDDPFPEANTKAAGAFEAIYGKATYFRQEDTGKLTNDSSNPWEAFLNVPSHVLPPLTKIGYAYIESLLEKQSN